MFNFIIIASLLFKSNSSCLVDFQVFTLKFDFEHAKNIHKDCLSRAHSRPYPKRKLHDLNHGVPVEADDYESVLHLTCIFKERGIMSENGIINKDVVKTIATRIIGEAEGATEDVKKVRDCVSQQSNQDETARYFYNCISDLVKKLNAE